jgi:hypothetical protein
MEVFLPFASNGQCPDDANDDAAVGFVPPTVPPTATASSSSMPTVPPTMLPPLQTVVDPSETSSPSSSNTTSDGNITYIDENGNTTTFEGTAGEEEEGGEEEDDDAGKKGIDDGPIAGGAADNNEDDCLDGKRVGPDDTKCGGEGEEGEDVASSVRAAGDGTGSSLSEEAVVGTVLALLLSVFACINGVYCCIHMRRHRRNVVCPDPYGTTVTVEELTHGRILVKKEIPQGGKTTTVEKTLYPNQTSAAAALKDYEHV